MGTLWDTTVADADLQQTLVTSNGGAITQCYNECSCSVKLGTNLQYNLYDLAGPLDAKTNPFVFVAGSQGTNGITPGYFMISYHYVFKNAIGASWDFVADWNTHLETEYDASYVSAINLVQNGQYNPGEIFILQDGKWMASGSPIVEPLESFAVALFAATPTAVIRTIMSTAEREEIALRE